MFLSFSDVLFNTQHRNVSNTNFELYTVISSLPAKHEVFPAVLVNDLKLQAKYQSLEKRLELCLCSTKPIYNLNTLLYELRKHFFKIRSI